MIQFAYSPIFQKCVRTFVLLMRGSCVMDGSVDESWYHMITASPPIIRTAGRQEDAVRLIQTQ